MINVKCKECGEVKLPTEFYPKSGGKCKACYKVYYDLTRGRNAARLQELRAVQEGRSMFTYTRQAHDGDIRFKRKHVAKRLLELTIALRNLSEEGKELADLLQEHIANRSAVTNRNYQAAQANTRSKTNGSTNPTGGAYMAGKKAGQAEASSTEEPDKLNQLKNLIYRWLVNAPTDDPAEIAPLIPAPVSMVRRIRTQMVDAGKLRPLDAQPEPPKQESLNV